MSGGLDVEFDLTLFLVLSLYSDEDDNLRSKKMKGIIKITDTIIVAYIHKGQPAFLPSMRGYNRRNKIIDIIAAPPISSRTGFSDFDSWTRSKAAINVPKPIGTFTRKISLQSRLNRFIWTRKPPRICPAVRAIPVVAPYKAIAVFFCFEVNVAWIKDSACGKIRAAAAPWNIRVMIRVRGSCAKAQNADVIVKDPVEGNAEH